MEAQPPATHPVRPCYSSVTMKQMFPVVKKLLSILLVPSPLLDQCGALALGGCIPARRMRGCVLPVSPETSTERKAVPFCLRAAPLKYAHSSPFQTACCGRKGFVANHFAVGSLPDFARDWMTTVCFTLCISM